MVGISNFKLFLILLCWTVKGKECGGTSCDAATKLKLIRERTISQVSDIMEELTDLNESIYNLKAFANDQAKEIEDLIRKNSNRFSTIKSKFGRLLLEEKVNGKTHQALVRRKSENYRQLKLLQMNIDKLRSLCFGEAVVQCPSHIVGRDCADIFLKGGKHSGIYFIQPSADFTPFPAYCDQETDGGGWTYIHSHVDDDLDFNRSWLSYKHGFGHVTCDGSSNLWMGNEPIHVLTASRVYYLRVDVMDWSDNEGYATYTKFNVGAEDSHYKLGIGGYVAATHPNMQIGDGFIGYNFGHADDISFTSHDNMKFSTFDRDNDMYQHGNCANQDGGGWWFNRCSAANLNGRIYNNGFYKAVDTLYGFDNAMIWGPWTGLWYSLKKSRMKIRPASFTAETLGRYKHAFAEVAAEH